ncbi:MAG: hypothetical protein AMXMBFR84_08960 [Candidatus Hydrogenedentota bacterium]
MTIAPAATLSPVARWEFGFLSAAILVSLALGFANLGAPSIWHDEAIHLYATESILTTGLPYLPSGYLYTAGLPYHYLLAPVVALFGRSEAVIRAPSVLMAAVNLGLLYFIARQFLGRPTAVIAVVLLCVSPWQTAWARETNFYMLHQTLFLLFFAAAWKTVEATDRTQAVRWGAATGAAYLFGGLTTIQTILFLGPVGAYAAVMALFTRSLRSRYGVAALVAAVAVAITLVVYVAALPQAEKDVVFKEGGIGGQTASQMIDRDRSDLFYYPRFLSNNLSLGYLIAAAAGFVWMCACEKKRGLYWMVHFVLPVAALTLLLGYKQHRFMFYCYPLYVGACAHGLVQLARFVADTARAVARPAAVPPLHRAWRVAAAAVIALFGARLAVSTGKLATATFATASGSHTTLAKQHPQWREPSLWVKERMDGAAVIATAYLPVHYYTGRVDNWFPSRVMVWEILDSGMEGLKTIDDLKAFMNEHPKGYFLADYRRFHQWPFFQDDVRWVEENMTKVDEASTEDVTVYAW